MDNLTFVKEDDVDAMRKNNEFIEIRGSDHSTTPHKTSESVTTPDVSSSSLKEKIRYIFTQITVEPLLFLSSFSTSILMLLLPSFIQYKICVTKLGYPEEICSRIETNETLGNITQDLATNLNMIKGSFMLATPVSSYIGGLLEENYGYMVVFITAISCSVITLLYIRFMLKESITVSAEDKSKNSFISFFDLKNLKGCFKTFIKPRENNNRLNLYLLFTISFITMVIVTGEAAMYYWYVQKKFKMSTFAFSQFITTLMFTATFGMLCIPLMQKVLKFSDATLGFIAFLNRIGKGLSFALVTEGWMMFASCIFLILSDLINPVSRAILSELVSQEELGKVFSIMGASEAITLAFSSIIYTTLYNETKEVFPGSIFILTSALSLLSAFLFSIVVKDSITGCFRKKNKPERPKNDQTKRPISDSFSHDF